MDGIRHHPAPSPSPSSKRRRISAPTLQSLPQQCLRQILRHLHAGPPSVSSLRPLLPLRTVCRSLRDAIDACIIKLDLSDLSGGKLPALLSVMPRFTGLTNLTLPPHALTEEMLPLWIDALPMLRRLTYVPSERDPTAQFFASRLANSLETLSTTSPTFLEALSGRSRVHTLEILMDEVDPDKIAGFPAVHIRLLYRSRLQRHTGEKLLSVLRGMNRLQVVELRLNNLSSEMYAMFPHVPHLRKLSLFDGTILPGERGVGFIANCKELEELHLEWMHGLSGADMIVLARGLGERLRKLRLWNCEGVCDEGLMAVAYFCPNAEVELRFVREQFGGAALAAFGERVSWASSM